MKIKDTITLGALAGVLASIPQLLFHYTFVQIGYIKYQAFQLTGSIFLVKELTNDPLGLVIGAVVWEILAAFIGIATAYLLIFTGTDNWWLKGILANGFIMYTFVYGIIYTLGGAKIVPFDIKTNFIVLLGSLIFGIAMPYFIIKLGDIENRHI